MMFSSMGSMGIAIGVAIDEGIAKDIRGAIVPQNHCLFQAESRF